MTLKLWIQQIKHRRQVNRLRSQWRAMERQRQLLQWPLRLMLAKQLRSLEACETASGAKTGSPPAARKPKPPTEPRTPNANDSPEPHSVAPSRRHCPAQEPPWKTTPQTQAGDSGPMPGIASVSGGPVPWDSQTLKPLFDQLIPTVEKLCVTKISNMATQARLPGELVRDIERDATWSEPAKKALTLSGPQLAAKYLNKTGISAENQPEVIFFTAAITIASGHAMIMKRLEKLIVIANANAQKPETKP